MRLLKGLIVLSLMVLASQAYAQSTGLYANTVEVIEGQELLIYHKSAGSLDSFKSETSSSLSGSSNVRFLGNKMAVAGLGRNSNIHKKIQKSTLQNACSKIQNAKIGCEINQVVKLLKTPNDSFWSSLPGLRKISAERAWDSNVGSKGVKVAVIDTGVDYSHVDLAANIAVNSAEIPGNGIDDDRNGYIDDYYGYNFAGGNSNPQDDNNHGTHVAGTIGAAGNNSAGVVGVNWQVGIIPVKVLNASGSGTLASVIQGVNYAVARGAHVMNLSLGGSGYSQSFYDAISRANDAGILFVAAAGNETNNNDSSPTYPAGYNLPNVISVAATDSSDKLASFSNYGATTVHIAAPGVSIASTIPGSKYATFSGTSMATPHVAGAAALLKAFSPSSSMLQIKSALLNNGDIISGLNGKVATSARLNLANALASLSGGAIPPIITPPADDESPSDPGSDNPGSTPGNGIGDPDDDEEEVYPVSYIGVKQKVANGKSKISIFLLDDEDYYVSDAAVSLSCGGKLIGQKVTGDTGTVSFSVKLKKVKTSCVVLASNELGSISKKLSVKRKATRR